MALTVNTNVDGGRQPSEPIMAGSVDVDLDNSYPLTASEGYPLTIKGGGAADVVPPGTTILHSEWVEDYDGSALRYARIVNGTLGPVLKVYAAANGAPGAEVANATDLSGHTGLVVGWIGK